MHLLPRVGDMNLKRWLLLAPLLLTLFLLQSYFWVPTYDRQTTGNPQRLVTYVEASSGDAEILNPILNADTSSSHIVAFVFEGLLDLDEQLNLRGRLATDWTISETAYLLIGPSSRFPDGMEVTGARLVSRVRAALMQDAFLELAANVRTLEVLPPASTTHMMSVAEEGGEDASKRREVAMTFHAPERVVFALRRVDQDFFQRLAPVIGDRYLLHFPYERYVEFHEPVESAVKARIFAQLPERFPVAEHNPVIDFHLRQGVRFHDGRALTARDVRFTYDAIMNPKNLSPRTADFEPIKRVEIIDDYTVRVVYKRLFSPAINAWTMGILPEHLLNAGALEQEMNARGLSGAAREAFGLRDSRFNRHPVGSGRFQFVEWQSDEFIHLRRNDDYWEGPAEYRDYYMRIVPDLLTQEMEFRAGAVDYYAAQPHQVVRYKSDDAYQSFSSPGFSYTYIGYNNRRPLFADPEVRRALGMAINVDDVVTYILYGEGARITGPYPANTPWYDPGVAPLPYDPGAARAMLEARGWRLNADGWLEKDGKIFEFTLITNSGNPLRKNIMTIAQNAWKKIGVKCQTQYFEWAVFLKDFINTADFDAVVLGWSMGIDPDLYQLWHSSQTGPRQLNFVGYRNPRADALMVRLRREYDAHTQRTLARRLHRLIADEQPYTFLYAPFSTRVLDKKIVLVRKHDNGSESYEKIYPMPSGDITFHFHQWRKLAFTPDL